MMGEKTLLSFLKSSLGTIRGKAQTTQRASLARR